MRGKHFSFSPMKQLIKGGGNVTGSPDLTCPSQLGSGSSANGVTEGGAEEGGAELYKGVWTDK